MTRARPAIAPISRHKTDPAAKIAPTPASAPAPEDRRNTKMTDPKASNRKLRSRITTDGLDRVPHRAFYRGQGLDDDAMARPMIGVVSTAGETSP